MYREVMGVAVVLSSPCRQSVSGDVSSVKHNFHVHVLFLLCDVSGIRQNVGKL